MNTSALRIWRIIAYFLTWQAATMLFDTDLVEIAKITIAMIFSSNPCIGNNANPVEKPSRAKIGAPQAGHPDARAPRIPLSKLPPVCPGLLPKFLNLYTIMAKFTPSIPDMMKVSRRERNQKVF